MMWESDGVCDASSSALPNSSMTLNPPPFAACANARWPRSDAANSSMAFSSLLLPKPRNAVVWTVTARMTRGGARAVVFTAEDPRPATDARCVRRDATLFTTKGEDADMAGGGLGDRLARSEVKCATLRGSSRQLLYNTFGTFVELESRHQTLLSLSVLSMATHAGATCT